MSRASPKNNSKIYRQRPLLPDALKQGVIDLHNYQKEIIGTQRPRFLIDVGFSISALEVGKKGNRVMLIITYARNSDESENINSQIEEAENKRNVLWHYNNFKGAYCFIANLRKEYIKKWFRKTRKVFIGGLVFGALVYGGLRPEFSDAVSKLIAFLTK